jgi:predicted transposase YdaD
LAKPFDATMNSLIDLRPEEWANFLASIFGMPPGTVEVVDSDLSATVQADKVFRIRAEREYLLHLEMESSSSLEVPARLMRYNVLLRHQAGLPVYSILMLLRPAATASDQNGTYRATGIRGETIHEFRYNVLRVWEQSIESLLGGGIAFTPLAMLTDEAAKDPAAAHARFRDRLNRESDFSEETREIYGLAAVLCGLRYNREAIEEMFMGGRNVLEDSVIYQDLIQRGEKKGRVEGRVEELRNTLNRLGSRKFGRANDTALQAFSDLERLERMVDRIFDATSWDDLLSTP